MSRQKKQGLDYFPLDVDIESDDKVYLIQAKHGIVGFGLLIKLFIKIYRNGYYTKFSEREEIIFAAQNNVDVGICKNIINDCINESIFDKSIYEKFKILTSIGIQKRYFKISERCKKIEYFKEITLIDASEYKNLNPSTKQLNVNIGTSDDNKDTHNANTNPTNNNNNPHDVDICTETKRNETKRNETNIKIETLNTSAASDGKTSRLPPKENESSNMQPDVTSGLPVTITQGMLSELPDKTIPDRLIEPSGETTQGEFSEPPVKITQDVFQELPVKTVDALTEPSPGQQRAKIKGVTKSPSLNGKIYFDYETRKFINITDSHIERWKNAYPAVDVLTELRQMEVWADTNRKNRKSDWQRFIVNWLKRSQDKARPIAPSWKGGEFGRLGKGKPTHTGEKEGSKGKYTDQVDEIIYTDA